MANFTKEVADKILTGLKSGRIKPSHKTKKDNYEYLPLEVIISTDYDVSTILKMAQEAIDLGCHPDDYAAKFSQTAIITVIDNLVYETLVESSQKYSEVLDLFLKYHTKGHDSDFFILKYSALSIEIFNIILLSGKVDVEATKNDNYIVSELAKLDNTSAAAIDLLFKYFPNINPNKLDRHGKSPLNVAIHQAIAKSTIKTNTVNALLKNENAKIIGPIDVPVLNAIINHDLIDRYDGNFFGDYPDTIEMVVSMGKNYLIPKDIRDIFVF